MKIKAEKIDKQFITPFEKDGVSVFRKEKGKDFNILQITDVHIGGGCLSRKKDRLALTAVRDLITYAKPDLVVVTGDVSYPIPVVSGSLNNMRPAKWFASLMENLGVPWCLVFGNHDCESYSTHKKSQLAKFYSSAPNCLFKSGDQNIFGEGNYVIRLENADGSLNNLLVMLDSNSYETNSFFSGFDIVHDDQVEWYEKMIKEHCKNGEPSLIFQHIPFREARDAWWAMQEKGKDTKYYLGAVLEHDQYFGVPHRYGKEFDTILKLGSTKGVFYGHDHLNTLSMSYKGVRLTYGMSIDYLAYMKIKNKKNQRGATLITIADDGSFDVSLVPLTTVRGEAKGGGLRWHKDKDRLNTPENKDKNM